MGGARGQGHLEAGGGRRCPGGSSLAQQSFAKSARGAAAACRAAPATPSAGQAQARHRDPLDRGRQHRLARSSHLCSARGQPSCPFLSGGTTEGLTRGPERVELGPPGWVTFAGPSLETGFLGVLLPVQPQIAAAFPLRACRPVPGNAKNLSASRLRSWVKCLFGVGGLGGELFISIGHVLDNKQRPSHPTGR